MASGRWNPFVCFVPEFYFFLKAVQMIVHFFLILSVFYYNFHIMRFCEVTFIVTNVLGILYSPLSFLYLYFSKFWNPLYLLLRAEISVLIMEIAVSLLVVRFYWKADPMYDAIQEIPLLWDKLNDIRSTVGLAPIIKMDPQIAWTDKLLERGESEERIIKTPDLSFYIGVLVMIFIQGCAIFQMYFKCSELKTKTKEISCKKIERKARLESIAEKSSSIGESIVASYDKTNLETMNEDQKKLKIKTIEILNETKMQKRCENIVELNNNITAETSVASNDKTNLETKNEDKIQLNLENRETSPNSPKENEQDNGTSKNEDRIKLNLSNGGETIPKESQLDNETSKNEDQIKLRLENSEETLNNPKVNKLDNKTSKDDNQIKLNSANSGETTPKGSQLDNETSKNEDGIKGSSPKENQLDNKTSKNGDQIKLNASNSGETTTKGSQLDNETSKNEDQIKINNSNILESRPKVKHCASCQC